MANCLLRELSLTSGFELVSNDNIGLADLSDMVHLNAAGTARLYGNFLNFLVGMLHDLSLCCPFSCHSVSSLYLCLPVYFLFPPLFR